jgi:hypothetical protein
MFVSEYSYTVFEHDVDEPWIIVSHEHRTVTLDDGADFLGWAREHWPDARWTVQLDPGQIASEWPP